jgi:hypothetical protein
MLVELIVAVGIITGGWYIAWNWKVKHMLFVRKFFNLDTSTGITREIQDQ